MAIPNNVIKLSRNQKAEYVSGSRAKGWFIYSLQIIKTKGASREYFSIESDKKATSSEATQDVWKKAKAWLQSQGEMKTDGSYYYVEI